MNTTQDSQNCCQSDRFAAPSGEPLDWLAKLLPIENLTESALRNAQPPVVVASLEEACQQLQRILYRSLQRHAIVTGEAGVGKTTLLRELARRGASGELPFLSERTLLRIDVSNVGPEDSRGCLETVFTALAATRTVLCLDGMAALLRRQHGGNNKPLLRAMLDRSGLSVIGTMSRGEYQDQIASDAAMRELFARIDLEEPHEADALRIVQQAAVELQSRFGIPISPELVERAVTLTSHYCLSARQPAKSIRLLTTLCEEADYDRTQLSQWREALTSADVIQGISRQTGIPAETIAGEDRPVGFEEALAATVVGQSDAVRDVSLELRLIKAGLTEPDKPATVLLFAGQTGVGKTELAKRIAALYSSSGRLTTYAMGNYTEPHSVSGIIGVPPGYVGHEEGGRLINELNADPYSVFLLDEAEKCHPNIWKPFLNLFDEGWIADQRGIRARADRAIFILTTNAGDRQIAQLFQREASPEEIEEQVRKTLLRVKQERSSQPVFPPQFLSRIRRIVVFRPLDAAAMEGIVRKSVAELALRWWSKRQRQVVIGEELINWLGGRSHALNTQADGNEGGRIVHKLVRDVVESRMQLAAVEHPDDYARAHTMRVSGAGEPDVAEPQVDVELLDAAGAPVDTRYEVVGVM